jgi:hypothetical protein
LQQISQITVSVLTFAYCSIRYFIMKLFLKEKKRRNFNKVIDIPDGKNR